MLKSAGIDANNIPADLRVSGLSCNSKTIREGELFIAISGYRIDGHNYIQEALQRGAAGVVSQKDFFCPPGRAKVIVRDTRQALVVLADSFFGHPSGALKVIGVTGTNGKTTTTYLIESILKSAEKKTGVIGTINYRFLDRVIPAMNTTPGPLELQALLKEMAQSSVGYVVMEVSSHSLDQNRVEKIDFAYGIFTNLTLDHLDYHKNMESYFDAKSRLFQSLAPSARAVLNQDDPYSGRLKSLTRAKVITYGFNPASDVRPLGLKLDLNGIEMEITTPDWRQSLKSKLLGRHNVYNLLAGAALAWAEGIKPSLIIEGLAKLESVPGRLEQVHAGQPYAVFVDYAHTDDALKNVLSTLRELTKEKIILVFGCGGDRDKSKRPLMGDAATRLADLVIITSDNPRSEDPAAIIKEIESGICPGMKNYEVVVDREDAIRKALYSAGASDTVVIAGKGHEPYQILKDTYIPFDDREVVRRILHGAKS